MTAFGKTNDEFKFHFWLWILFVFGMNITYVHYMFTREYIKHSHYDDIVIVQHKFAAIAWLGQAFDIAKQQAVEL